MLPGALPNATTQLIDDGGRWFSPDGSQPYVTWGTKWGAGSPFPGGADVPGPQLPGGTVTYSFMVNGIGMSAEPSDPTVAITSLPTYAPCFLTDIGNAFAAWSAVANIQFVQVADNGVAFNASGAAGDIRIAAHTFDGPSATVGHGFFPPLNGTSASGDVHFDRQENWSCTPGSGLIDIGIIAAHEIGHAIGLAHEFISTALMNPFYNPAVLMPLADDIIGSTSIYGPRQYGPYDFDQLADIAVFRNTTGQWFVRRSEDGQLGTVSWGAPALGDTPAVADFDGDLQPDIAVYRTSTVQWFILGSSTGFSVVWGCSSCQDISVPSDYDGDGRADIAVYRTSTGEWFIRRSSDGGFVYFGWGAPFLQDLPVPGDYDGDGTADIAVYRSSTGEWFIRRSSDGGLTHLGWGAPSLQDRPVPADYDGDGDMDIAVYRPSTGEWFIRRSSDSGLTHLSWGAPSLQDRPVPADYDGDEEVDIAVYRPSTGEWFIRRSSDGGLTHANWGSPASGDRPAPLR